MGEPPQHVLAGRLSVGELMQPAPYSVGEAESVLLAWEVLERSGQRHLPVVRADGCCAGLLDRAELAVACAAPASALSRRTVGELTRGRRTVTVHGEEPVRRAAAAMWEGGTDALPVTDAHGHLVGLLTARDVAAAVAGLPRREESAAPRSVRLPGLPPRPGRTDRGITIP
ncbi:HPP family protein [Streptomyces sp. NPDC086766]|uniref:CBS domain-containing protein n=1 Tax=Streptomyces sp. NPDC086766 TaxID=3365754 RepID=UPI0038100897